MLPRNRGQFYSYRSNNPHPDGQKQSPQYPTRGRRRGRKGVAIYLQNARFQNQSKANFGAGGISDIFTCSTSQCDHGHAVVI